MYEQERPLECEYQHYFVSTQFGTVYKDSDEFLGGTKQRDNTAAKHSWTATSL